jgi:hypothetical protein
MKEMLTDKLLSQTQIMGDCLAGSQLKSAASSVAIENLCRSKNSDKLSSI